MPTRTSASSGARLRARSNAASAGAYSDGSAVSRTRWRRAKPRSRWAPASDGSASMAARNRSISSTVADPGAGAGDAVEPGIDGLVALAGVGWTADSCEVGVVEAQPATASTSTTRRIAFETPSA